MKTYSEFNLETGIFTSVRVHTGDGQPQAQPGYDWWPDTVDHTALKVSGRTLVTYEPPVVSTAAVDARTSRTVLLAACDWTQVQDAPLTAAQRIAWAAYRTQLRDVTLQPGFPVAIRWPAKP